MPPPPPPPSVSGVYSRVYTLSMRARGCERVNATVYQFSPASGLYMLSATRRALISSSDPETTSTSGRRCDPRSNEKPLANDADSPDVDLSLLESFTYVDQDWNCFHCRDSNFQRYMDEKMNLDLIVEIDEKMNLHLIEKSDFIFTNKCRMLFYYTYIYLVFF